ncbi:helix-turn-helix domain-containing protein [Clostridium perfringens]|uniref:helix-turn-helix domain-containing protein n=1 Tax=Clostridium perfringens TaxID=1502 RepID=UPI00244ACBC7|nr:helix-turn-helix domain-containing protein [Clostridium perfringens]MDH2459483.1 helix-turn-helix domain-containing protein [Clostridium perfringens]
METNNKNFIQVNGIMSQGYGFSPQVVMRDTRLTVEAKAIYAYMSSFAGSGLSAFPTIELQLHELGMGAKRYYKHRKLLEDLGYITIKQTRIKKDGKSINDKNVYTLEQFPVEKNNEDSNDKNINSENGQNDQTDKNSLNTNFSEVGQNEQSHNEQSHNDQSNSNSLNSNNLNSNNNISSSSKEDEEEVKKLLDICQLQEFKLSRKDIKALLLVYSFDKIAKGIITSGSTNTKIKNYKGYLVSVLNDLEKVKKVDININDKVSKKSNANFTQRDQDMNELEKQLLGWEQ